MSLGGLYDTTICWWILVSGFVKTMFFVVDLWSILGEAMSVTEKRHLPQNISGMRQDEVIS